MPTPKKKPVAKSAITAHAELRGELAQALPELAEGLQADPIWGNSDVLVNQWRTQFAKQDIDPLTFAIRIRRIAMLLDEWSMRECEQVGLKLNEMLLLMALRRVGPPHAMRPTDILKMHSVTSGTATYRIDQLTKQDLAERIPDPTDRRGYLIRLTPRGLEIIDKLMRRLMAESQRMLEPMWGIAGGPEVLEESLRLYERCLTPR